MFNKQYDDAVILIEITIIVKLITLIFTDLHVHSMNFIAITQEPVSADWLTGNVI